MIRIYHECEGEIEKIRSEDHRLASRGLSSDDKGRIFLAHRIRISDILSWDRKSYLTHAILPRLSRYGCTLVELDLMHKVVK